MHVTYVIERHYELTTSHYELLFASPICKATLGKILEYCST